MNPNKWFRSLGLRAKLVIAFVSFTLLPLMIMGSYGLYVHLKDLQNIAISCLNQDVLTTTSKINEFLQRTKADIQLLQNDPSFQALLRESRSDPGRYRVLKTNAQQDIANFLSHRTIYHAVQYLNRDQDKGFILETRHSGGPISVSTPSKPFDSSPFFEMVKMMHNGSVSVAPIVFEEDGKTTATINYVVPFFDDSGQIHSLLATSIFADEFLTILNEYNEAGDALLLNGNGDYIYDSRKGGRWGKFYTTASLTSGDSESFIDNYPLDVASRVISGDAGVVEKDLDEILSFAPVVAGFDASNLVYCRRVPKAAILSSVLHLRNLFIPFIGISILLAVLLGFIASGTLTHPLRNLIEGAHIVGEGNYDHVIKVETNDEIELLANEFQQMATSLKRREGELEDYGNRLEARVEERTRELFEEKNKLQAVLDNVPSAFILLDRHLLIQSWSAALSNIVGEPVDHLVGKKCEDLAWYQEICPRPIAAKALDSGTAEMYLSRRVQGSKVQFIEHTAIPVFSNDDAVSVIEIISDVTDRKRNEQRMIQAEKMSIVGAMSAMVAHEIRNSLASIRILLQLQAEGSLSIQLNSSDDERNTIFSSIDRMESLIHGLLRFSKPAPLEVSRQGFNSVIRAGLDFARLQTAMERVQIEESYSTDDTDLLIDGAAFRDVVVNLVLNAAQSMQNEGTIRLTTEEYYLDNDIDEMSFTIVPGSGRGRTVTSLQGNDVCIPAGTAVVKLTVSDDGPGISENDLPHIFEPFYSTKAQGTGLGLAIVHRTVNEHGGLIFASSEENKSTEFSIILPIENN